MLLTRVWFLVLAVAAILGLSTALLARGVINREQVGFVDEQLRRDRFSAEMLLKLDARARLDALAPIAADGTVRDAVRGKRDGKEARALAERLRSMNQRLDEMRADLLMVIDGDGMIVAQEGRRPARAGAGLGKVPLVERALAGFLGDDTWVYDGTVYRVAARPIIDRGAYVGAVVHAQKLDDVLAQRMSDRLGGPSVGFFFRERLIAGYAPTDRPGAPTQAELTTQLASARSDEHLQKGERTEPYDLEGRGRAIFSLVAGSASASEVGYAVARSYPTMQTPWEIFERATKEDIAALPRLWLVLGGLALFALAMGIMYLERDWPLKVFASQVRKLADGPSDELDLPRLHRPHRKIGELIHKAIDRLVEKGGGSRQKATANLDEILGPAPESLTSSAFSFGGEDKSELSGAAKVAALPPPAPARMPPPAPLKPPPAPQKPLPPGFLGEEKSVALRLDSVMGPGAPGAASSAASAEEEAHFRDVYGQFIAMRRQCGEETADLSYERLLDTLQKTRDQILKSRPDAKGVRFTVYAKEGKAALKAAPRKA